MTSFCDMFPVAPVQLSVWDKCKRGEKTVDRFKRLASEGRVSAFIACKMSFKIYGFRLTQLWYRDRKLMLNYTNSLQNAEELNPFKPDNCLWDNVERRLDRNPRAIRNRSNADTRLGFCIDRHVFLVKANFTFGTRQVDDRCSHVIETTFVPLLFYHLPEQTRHEQRINVFNRSFEKRDQCFYVRYVLQPWTRYRVPAKTIYVLLSVQKTLFSCFVMSEEVADQVGRIERLESPFAHKNFLNDPYAVPPQTPMSVAPPEFAVPRIPARRGIQIVREPEFFHAAAPDTPSPVVITEEQFFAMQQQQQNALQGEAMRDPFSVASSIIEEALGEDFSMPEESSMPEDSFVQEMSMPDEVSDEAPLSSQEERMYRLSTREGVQEGLLVLPNRTSVPESFAQESFAQNRLSMPESFAVPESLAVQESLAVPESLAMPESFAVQESLAVPESFAQNRLSMPFPRFVPESFAQNRLSVPENVSMEEGEQQSSDLRGEQQQVDDSRQKLLNTVVVFQLNGNIYKPPPPQDPPHWLSWQKYCDEKYPTTTENVPKPLDYRVEAMDLSNELESIAENMSFEELNFDDFFQ